MVIWRNGSLISNDLWRTIYTLSWVGAESLSRTSNKRYNHFSASVAEWQSCTWCSISSAHLNPQCSLFHAWHTLHFRQSHFTPPLLSMQKGLDWFFKTCQRVKGGQGICSKNNAYTKRLLVARCLVFRRWVVVLLKWQESTATRGTVFIWQNTLCKFFMFCKWLQYSLSTCSPCTPNTTHKHWLF